MLDYIRSNAQSWGVKAAFGIIILVFVFWGVGSMQSSNSSAVVATVNDQPILVGELAKKVQLAEENIRRSAPTVTREQLKQMQIVQGVLQQLVVETLLTQEAERLGLSVSPVQLRRVIGQMPVFQNEQGQFDPAVYKRVLEAQRQNMGAFEDSVRKGLLEENIRQDVTDGAWVSGTESRAFFDFAQEARDVEYIFYPASEQNPAQPAEDACKAWYESNRTVFTVPAKVDVEYIRVRPKDLVKPDAVSKEDVAAWYEKNKNDYTSPEHVKARHILILFGDAPTPEAVSAAQKKIESIADELAKGGDFAALATKYSQDTMTAPKGGELGVIERGVTVPEFENAAFALKPGEVSKPVRTKFGMHLIKVDAKEPAKVTPLAEVEKEIRERIAEQQGADKMRDTADALVEANILGKPLADVAKTVGVAVQKSGMETAANLQKTLQLVERDIKVLLQTPAKTSVDTALETADNGIIIARVQGVEPETVKPYEAVKGEVVKTLGGQEARKLALQAAKDARAALDKGQALPQAKAKVISGVLRDTTMPVFGQQPDMISALFAATPSQWLPAAYAVTIDGAEGAVLVRPKTVATPDNEQWQKMQTMVEGSLQNQRKEQMFQTFVGILLNKGKVEIVNPGLLQELEKME